MKRLMAIPVLLALAGCGTLENSGQLPPSRQALPGPEAGSLQARLLEDVAVTLELGPAQAHPDGTRSWTGHVVGEPLSSAVLVERDQVVSGSVICLRGTFELRGREGDQWEVRQRQPHLSRCATGGPEPRRRQEVSPMTALHKPEATGASLATVDLFVVYNDRTIASLGSVAAVEAKIREMVELANEAYANSEATVRLNLVGSSEVSYTQASTQEITADDREALRQFATGAFARDRAALGIDLMSLLLSVDPAPGSSFTSGIAHLPNRSTGLSPNLAFSAVAVEGAPDVLAHEIGHNFGCQHDLDTPHAPPSQALYPYAYGYRRPGVWATVMAYAQGDEVVLPLFSTPYLTLQGVATGVKDVAENWRAVSLSAPVIAAYQTPAPAPTPSPGGLSLTLNAGWNAVAFRTQKVTSLASNSAVAGLATFDGTSYQVGNFDTVSVNEGDGPRRGMFVFASASTTVSYNGTGDSQGNFVNLKTGWNLCAFPSSEEVAGSALRAEVDAREVPLANTVLPQFTEIRPGGNGSVDVAAGGRLQPGRAYWVYSVQTARLSW